MSNDLGLPELNIILFGLSGSGVSSTANSIIGKYEFEVNQAFDTVTKECQSAYGFQFGRQFVVIDTPGFPSDLMGTRISEIFYKFRDGLALVSPGPNVFVLVTPIDRFTEDSKLMIRCLKQLTEMQKYIIVIFTGSDKISGSFRIARQKNLYQQIVIRFNATFEFSLPTI